MHLISYRSKHFVFLSPNFNSPHLSSVISKQDNMAKGTKKLRQVNIGGKQNEWKKQTEKKTL